MNRCPWTGVKRRLGYLVSPFSRDTPVRLAVCAIFRDEAPNLAEWLTFHRLQGVERFYLYDNRSEDDWRAEIAQEIATGVARVRKWPYERGQRLAYSDCLERRPRAEWVAFIDVDEFLFSPAGLPLPDVLAAYSHHAAVTVNWRTYGHGGHRTRPDDLVTASYLTRGVDDHPINHHVKSIVRADRTVGPSANPHVFEHDGSAVGEDHQPQSGPLRRPPTVEILRINHYQKRSEEEFRRKVAGPRSDHSRVRQDDGLDALRDEIMLQFVPAVREALARRERTCVRGHQ